jgi:hypothetical protein
MAEQRPMGFVKGLALPLTLDVVGLRDVNGDDTICVTGQHRLRTVWRSGLEFEH